MPTTYPAPTPTLSGDFLTISRFLNSPTMVARRIRTLAEQRFISDAILTNPIDVQGGAVLYEQSDSIFAVRDPQAVGPGAEYPMTPVDDGTAAIAAPVKWGEDVPITDEAIKRLGMNPVNKALRKIVNSTVRTVDRITLAAVASVITLEIDASGTSDTYPDGFWANDATTVPKILRDVLLAKAQITKLDEGYDPDTLVCDDIMFAILMSDQIIASLLRRETPESPVYTGRLPIVGDLRILPTANMPSGNRDAWVLDSTQLGGMADEKLAGPGYAAAVQGVETKSIRDDKRDKWDVRARRNTVPIVQEPNAICRINNVIGS